MFLCGMVFETTYHFRLATAGRSAGDLLAPKQLRAKQGFWWFLFGSCWGVLFVFCVCFDEGISPRSTMTQFSYQGIG